MNQNEPSVYVVLLHWKDYEDTYACIKSLDHVTYRNIKIIVVDNFSNDGSFERLKEEFDFPIYLQNSANWGFSRGCNTGLKHAINLGADYVLLLNNDMEVIPSFLEPAIKIAQENSNVGAVTGKILYKKPQNVFWQAGGHVHPWRVQGIPRGKGEIDSGQYNTVCDTGWASGAMSLFPRKTFERIGYLPEEYFFGQEEWDYSTAILKAGLRIIYVPEFKAYHEAGGSYKAGHPILNIYGGYLSKMIYAEKYMTPIGFRIWKAAFWVYLQTRWPKLAREGCQCEEDYKVKLAAGYLAFKDHKRIKYVGLEQLEDAARRIGPAPSWGLDWVSR